MTVGTSADAVETGRAEQAPARAPGRLRRLTRRDKTVLTLMTGVPTSIMVVFVWIPALASIYLSFTTWDGIGLGSIKWVGLQNYRQIFTIYPQFWPAVWHNVIWLAVLAAIPTPFGLFLAYQLDKRIRFSRLYQSAFFLPVAISGALIGFVWELIYNPDHGLINSLFHTNNPNGTYLDWVGHYPLNLIAVLVAASWRHTGYMMILYLAGLKSVDPALKDAAAVDGANEWQAFRHVIFPSLRPINVVVAAVTVIEALRAFDIVYVFNKGENGTELLSVLITNNIIGEASRIGYGSAIAVILLVVSLAAIIPYLIITFRKERRA
jgi:multiple sugar transport system permease protein/raffinose/stachyose/melibiose transport system permease protein